MSAFTLKIIALLSMLWDHVTYVFPVSMTLYQIFPSEAEVPLFDALDFPLAFIGRIAAPIFLWSIAQGYRHTRDWRKYALRLFLFACLAEGPYYLLFKIHGNIIFTLLVGLLTLRLMDWGNKRQSNLGYALAALVTVLSWHFAFFEGGGRYILFILAFYLTDHWAIGKKALLWLFLLPSSRWRLLCLYFTEGFRLSMFILNGVGPLLGVALTFFYNGKKGCSFRGDKYIWYVFYPAHLLILGLLQYYTQFPII